MIAFKIESVSERELSFVLSSGFSGITGDGQVGTGIYTYL